MVDDDVVLLVVVAEDPDGLFAPDLSGDCVEDWLEAAVEGLRLLLTVLAGTAAGWGFRFAPIFFGRCSACCFIVFLMSSFADYVRKLYA